MLRIRMSRKGKKKQPSYRVVVTDKKFKRDGRFVENIGHYNPLVDPPVVNIKEERALYWLSVGAQPSDAVKRFLEKQGTYDRLKRLHAGEELEALVAEYKGEPMPSAMSEETEEAAETEAPADSEEEESIVESAVETVEETASDVADAAESAIETVVETVEEAVETAADVVTGDEDDSDDEDEEEKA